MKRNYLPACVLIPSVPILPLLICIFFGCTINPYADERNPSPHIILINADDLGYGDLGCYGATKVQTPNIDTLAQEGIIFTDAHSPSAVCSPSRYGLLTGTYPLLRNLWGPVGLKQGLVIDTHRQTLASVLKEAGYATACIGKWHLGFGEDSANYNGLLKPGPLELGFDYYFGVPSVNSGPPFVYVENHQVVGWDPDDPFVYGVESTTEKWPAKGGYKAIGGAKAAHDLYKDEQIGTTLVHKAIDYVKGQVSSDTESPFFLYLATTNIHHPFTPAPRFKGSSQAGRYGDFIHELDWMVGELLSALDEMGIAENTLVIFTSDNGGMLNQGGQDAYTRGHRLNGALLGFKFGAWEGGHRVPFIARWPGKIPANSQSDQLISHIDLLSTFAEITGKTLAGEDTTDGISILPILTGNAPKTIREHLLISPNRPTHVAVRKGDWVYIPAQDEGGFQGKEPGAHLFGGAAVLPFSSHRHSDIVNGEIRPDAPPAQLYDLSEDLSQTTNLYHQYPDKVQEMEALLLSYQKKIGPYPVTGWINW